MTTECETAPVIAPASIGDQVFKIIGRPDGFDRVVTRHLYDTRYRVNVYCRTSAAQDSHFFAKYAPKNQGAELIVGLRIAASFFVKTSPTGEIVTTSPSIN